MSDHEITDITPYCFCKNYNHTRTAKRMKLKCHFKNNLQRLMGLSAHRIPVLHDPFSWLTKGASSTGNRIREETTTLMVGMTENN